MIGALFSFLILAAHTPAPFAAESCTVFQIGKNQSFLAPEFSYGMWLSTNGKKIVIALNNNQAFIRDLETEQETVFSLKNNLYAANFSPDGKKVIILETNASIPSIRNLETKTEIKIESKWSLQSADFSPDGKKIVTVSDANKVFIHDSETGKIISAIEGFGDEKSARFSPDGKKVVTTSKNGSATIHDLESGRKTKIQTKSDSNESIQFSPDGKKILFSSREKIIIHNLETNQNTQMSFSEPIKSAQFSADGKKILTASAYFSRIEVTDPDTKEKKFLLINGDTDANTNAAFAPDGKTVATLSSKIVKISTIDSTCADSISIEDKLCSTCGPDSSKNLDHTTQSWLDQYLKQERCSQQWNEKTWAQDTSLPVVSPLTQKQALAFLTRFQKPEGFDPKKHLSILLAIFNSSLVTQKPSLVQGAIQTVLTHSNMLYEELLKKFPKLVEPSPNSSTECRNSEDNLKIQDASLRYLRYLIKKNDEQTNLKNWNTLAPLRPYLAKLTPAQKSEYIDVIAESLAQGAAQSNQGIFTSKLYHLAYPSVDQKFFGGPKKTLTDFTYIRKKNLITPVLLGLDPIDGDSNTESDYGFYIKKLPEDYIPAGAKPGDKIANHSYSWTQDGKPYKTDWSAIVGSTKNIIPIGNTLPYEKIWKDKTLSGTIVVGNSVKGISDRLQDNYISYYSREGFVFESTPMQIPDLKKWLADEVSSGRTDYFLKEAHSDGDNINLFRIDKKAKVMRGVRKLPGGKVERIQFVFPDSSSTQTEQLSNSEFGQWIREREKKNQGPLVYINGSCNSIHKAVPEIEAAASPALIEIPTITNAYGFTDERRSAKRTLIDGIRNSLSYAKIRDNLLADNDGYKKQIQDAYIFPDDQAYQERINEVLKVPLQINLKMTGPDGKPYHPPYGH